MKTTSAHTNSTNDYEWKAAEQALLESKQHYQTLAQISPVGIFQTDAKGTTTYVNPMWCQISGLSEDEAKEDGWMQAVHPEDRKKLEANWKASVEEQTASSAEYRFIHPDGSIIWVIGQAAPEKNTEGKTIGYIGTITNITENKRVEEKLEESEKNLQDKVSGLNLLSDTTSKILETDTYDNIYTILGEMLFQFSGADYMIMAEYKEEYKSVVIKQLFGTKPYLETIARKVAIDFSQVKIPVKDLADQLNFSHRRKIYPVEGGLYSLTAKNIPKTVCKAIEKITGLHELYSIGLMWKENYFGGITFGFKKGKEFKNRDLIESFVSQASLALSIKYAEKALIVSEDRFRTIFNESPIGIELYNADGTAAVSNNASLNMFGIADVSEILGFNIFEGTSLSPDNKERLRNGEAVAYQAIFDFEKVKKLQQYKTSKTGKAYFDYVITPLLDTERKTIMGYLLQVQDITERKQAEETLRESEEKYRYLFANNPQPMWIYDFETLAFLEVNHAAIDHYGYSREEFLAMTIKDIRSTEDIPALVNHLVQSNRLINLAGEWRHIKKNGELIIVDIISHSVIFKGRNARHVLIHDITDRKQAREELILAKEKAEESDKLKTYFLNNISHEIRTPLNGLLGFLSILQDKDFAESERDGYISIINKSAYRFMNTIDDIVEISLIQAGHTKMTASETNVRKLISELCCRYQPEAEFDGLEFLLKDELPDGFESIYTDHPKLSAILSVLLNNAIKFTKEGSIEFGYGLVETRHALFLRFFIKDTGIGIPEDKRQTIFERFMQVDSSETRSFEGSGLGLTIAKAYVDMLGGKIWVESDPYCKSGRQGSTFYFTIPYNAVPEEKTGVEKVLSFDNTVNQINPDVPRLKILIVEDDEMSELFLRKVIKLFSKEILHAKTGAEAVKASRNNPDIDLILMDIKMPNSNGYDATRQIRQFNKKVVIIAQTAFGLMDDREKAIESGCNDYISKPVKKDELVAMVGKYFKIQEEEGRW